MATTQGFVQRITWISSGPLICFAVGPSPSSVEALFVQVRPGDSQAVIDAKMSLVAFLTNAQMSGCEVIVTHGDTSAEITAVGTVAADTAANPLQLDAIEVTQSIQDLGHSIPLIAGKRTVVRVCLSYYSALPVNVSGTISVRNSPSDPPTIINSENTVAVLPAEAGNVLAKRTDAAKSLNFVLPAARTAAGPLSITIGTITNTDTAATIPVGGLRIPVVQFQDFPPLRVRILAMRYTMGSPPVSYVASSFHVNMLLSWLGRAYPAAQVINSVGVVDVTAAVPGFSCGDINAQLAALRALDMAAGGDERTHYYGCVDDGGYWMRGCTAGIPGTVASGPTGAGTWGWDLDGSYGDWYGGHELGHTYGRLHPGFCGETANDLDNYPFPFGQIGTDNSFVGFDVGDPINGLPLAAMPGTLWKDVMTYCNRQWISPYTYLGIRKQILTEDSASGGGGAGAGAGSGETLGGRPDERFPDTAAPQRVGGPSETGKRLVSVVGIVNLTKKQGHIRYVNPLERGKESGTMPESPAVLRAKAADGSVLSDYPVRVRLSSELTPADDRTGVFDAVITLDERTASIELLIDGQLADSVSVGGDTPKPRAVRVAQDRAAKEITLAVEADTVAERNTRYAVQVSTDGGYTWHTVAVGLTEPVFNIDRSQFKPGDQVEVRVLVTNGLETSVVKTERFRV